KEQFTYNEETKKSGPLSGDATLLSVKSNLQATLVASVTGLPAGWNALSLIGLESDSSGLLALKSDTFTKMAQNDFAALRRVLAAEGTTPPCARPAGTSVHGVCDLIGNVEEWLQGPPPSRVGGGFRAALDADLTTPRPGAPLDSAALGFRLCRPLAEEIP
ncbi:flagellar filament capping protein FliD, partial [Myxococcota bacterium]|nr:flagellar filament capping protein FliD [Myxococcota bacterium]